MFATGNGIQQLVYFCAMESQRISVINGCEKGGKTGDIYTAVAPDMLNSLKPDYHMFLDNLTGDVYRYHSDKQEW